MKFPTIAVFIAILALSAPALAADKVKLSYVLSSVEYADLFWRSTRAISRKKGSSRAAAGGRRCRGAGTHRRQPRFLDLRIGCDQRDPQRRQAQGPLRGRCASGDADLGAADDRELCRSQGPAGRDHQPRRHDRDRDPLLLAKRGLPADYVSYTPLGTGLARFAAIAAGTYPAALVNASEIEDMRATGKLGNLHRLVDLRQEITMTYNALATSTRSSRRTPISCAAWCARS